MAEKNELSMVRISKDAHEKLKTLARKKHCKITALLGWLVDCSYHEGINIYGPLADELKNIRTDLYLVNIRTTKIAGSAERTETFIKTLLSQDRPAVQGIPDDSADSSVSASGCDDSVISALSALLGRLLDRATRTKNFDGTQAMQIRISMDEFARIQNQYEQVCTLRNS